MSSLPNYRRLFNAGTRARAAALYRPHRIACYLAKKPGDGRERVRGRVRQHCLVGGLAALRGQCRLSCSLGKDSSDQRERVFIGVRQHRLVGGLAALCCLAVMVLGVEYCLAAEFGTAGTLPDVMVALDYQGTQYEGKPLVIGDRRILLLGRDGRLWDLPATAGNRARQTASAFRPYSPSEMRAALLRELGGGFEVSGAGCYMVAHPVGQHDRWADRFDEFYRSFVRYFTVRGIVVDPPPAPLVAIVCRDAEEFVRRSAGQQAPVNAAVLGWYDAESNRLMIYDRGRQSSYFTSTEAVLVHEATHQAAFNTGIHSRWAMPPRWVAEGLATMFEAPGVFDARRYPRLSDRINRMRCDDFARFCDPQRTPDLLRTLVADESLFARHPETAYAAAWALSFYLTETMPAQYGRYVRSTAERPAWHRPSPAERLRQFAAVFGDNWPLLEARWRRFIAELPNR